MEERFSDYLNSNMTDDTKVEKGTTGNELSLKFLLDMDKEKWKDCTLPNTQSHPSEIVHSNPDSNVNFENRRSLFEYSPAPTARQFKRSLTHMEVLSRSCSGRFEKLMKRRGVPVGSTSASTTASKDAFDLKDLNESLPSTHMKRIRPWEVCSLSYTSELSKRLCSVDKRLNDQGEKFSYCEILKNAAFSPHFLRALRGDKAQMLARTALNSKKCPLLSNAALHSNFQETSTSVKVRSINKGVHIFKKENNVQDGPLRGQEKQSALNRCSNRDSGGKGCITFYPREFKCNPRKMTIAKLESMFEKKYSMDSMFQRKFKSASLQRNLNRSLPVTILRSVAVNGSEIDPRIFSARTIKSEKPVKGRGRSLLDLVRTGNPIPDKSDA